MLRGLAVGSKVCRAEQWPCTSSAEGPVRSGFIGSEIDRQANPHGDVVDAVFKVSTRRPGQRSCPATADAVCIHDLTVPDIREDRSAIT